jgi:integrase-like protein
VIAFGQVKEARRTREDEHRPFVVVDLETDDFIFMLAVTNLGTTLARDVSITITPALDSSVAGTDLSKIKLPDAEALELAEYKIGSYFTDLEEIVYALKRLHEPVEPEEYLRLLNEGRKPEFPAPTEADRNRIAHILAFAAEMKNDAESIESLANEMLSHALALYHEAGSPDRGAAHWRTAADGQQVWRSFKTREEADLHLANVQVALVRNELRAPVRVTFRKAAEAWLEHGRDKGLAASTIRDRRSVLDHWLLPAFGDRKLETVTAAMVTTWRRQEMRTLVKRNGKERPKMTARTAEKLTSLLFLDLQVRPLRVRVRPEPDRERREAAGSLRRRPLRLLLAGGGLGTHSSGCFSAGRCHLPRSGVRPPPSRGMRGAQMARRRLRGGSPARPAQHLDGRPRAEVDEVGPGPGGADGARARHRPRPAQHA